MVALTGSPTREAVLFGPTGEVISDYPVGILSLEEEGGPNLIQVIAISVVQGRVLVAVPAWHRVWDAGFYLRGLLVVLLLLQCKRHLRPRAIAGRKGSAFEYGLATSPSISRPR